MDLDRDLIEATQREFQRRGARSHRQLAVSLEVERINRLVQLAAQPALAAEGLTFAGWQALTALSFHPAKQMATAKLALRVGAHPTTITRTVDRLERSKLVRRTQGSDRRVTVVALLPAGEAAQEAVATSFDSGEFGLGGVPAESLDELAAMLRQVRLLVEGRMDASD
ncbi:MarR family winged helix-turn-helix transcriptional regulator [Streptomyces phaeochromogenes]|uniref:MarR family winged helix-turn-helix transcriptional regulator n=1 Tax=Streptomyces phaeochromogenes TaxID=1923 RepID=UPI0038666F60|nr:MarR family transcriptional regulator [Streptomyces phaeochromogenes]